jgi:hypothetical protein
MRKNQFMALCEAGIVMSLLGPLEWAYLSHSF